MVIHCTNFKGINAQPTLNGKSQSKRSFLDSHFHSFSDNHKVLPLQVADVVLNKKTVHADLILGKIYCQFKSFYNLPSL